MEVKEEQTFIFYWIWIPVYSKYTVYHWYYQCHYSTLYATGITSVIFDICPHAGGYKHLNVLIDIMGADFLFINRKGIIFKNKTCLANWEHKIWCFCFSAVNLSHGERRQCSHRRCRTRRDRQAFSILGLELESARRYVSPEEEAE